MTQQKNLREITDQYHWNLPDRLRNYLNNRGITDTLIDFHLLGWNGRRITIPIFNREGNVAFFKFAKDLKDKSPGPKMLTSPGAYAELYGWEHVLALPRQVVICEGEFDRLVLESKGFRAVTSTGGAGTFREEWARDFELIPEVYVCFDRDEAGKKGAIHVARLIPHAKIVTLPAEVGDSGDVTDFFVRLGRMREDFLELLKEAKPAPAQPEPVVSRDLARIHRASLATMQQVERVKNRVPIERAIGEYVKLQRSGKTLVGLCPFHDDHVPSLTVYPETGSFHCFGCGKHGDVINFLREVEQLSFREALNALDTFDSSYGANP